MDDIDINLDEFDFDCLCDNADTLIVKLCNKKTVASIVYDSHICYRVMDEGDYISLLSEMKQTPGLRGLIFSRTSQSSDFIGWFLEQNRNIRNIGDLIHSIISTDGPIIEVISLEIPKILSKEIC